MSPKKIERLKRLANKNGIIAAAAMDQRLLSLQRPLAAAKGVAENDITPEMMSEFKSAVTRILSPYASAFLLDPDFGLPATKLCAASCGLMLAYEKLPYDISRPNRMPLLAESLTVRQLIDMGAQGIKIVLHYSPLEPDKSVNEIKHSWVERIGAECEAHQVPFFLEPIGYDPSGIDERSFDFAGKKPDVVIESIREFTKPRYFADVLKVEVPVTIQHVEGTPVFQGRRAYTREEALAHFKRAAEAATKPFIYLSAGVDNAQFLESLRLAAEAETGISGVLCGQATWKDGIPIYAKRGINALEEWLAEDGVRNIQAIDKLLESARPWWSKLGMAAANQLDGARDLTFRPAGFDLTQVANFEISG